MAADKGKRPYKLPATPWKILPKFYLMEVVTHSRKRRQHDALRRVRHSVLTLMRRKQCYSLSESPVLAEDLQALLLEITLK